VVIGDGHLGIWGALAAVFPRRRAAAVLESAPPERARPAATHTAAKRGSLLTKIPYAETREEASAEARVSGGVHEARHADVGRVLDRDWERMVTFYQFRASTGSISELEPGGVALRRGSVAGRPRPSASRGGRTQTAVIWKTLLIAEKTFRRLDAPESLADVASGSCTLTEYVR